jgi:predicted Zn-dependent protease
MRQRAQARRTRPEWALLLNDAGYILADANVHLDRAHEAVSAAMEAMPLQGAFVDSVGWALYRKGELVDAAFYLERARRHTPDEDLRYSITSAWSTAAGSLRRRHRGAGEGAQARARMGRGAEGTPATGENTTSSGPRRRQRMEPAPQI